MPHDDEAEADFYQSHKDDQDVWAEPVPSRRGHARGRSTVVSVRFTPEELDRLRQESPDGNVSRLIRNRALAPPQDPVVCSQRVPAWNFESVPEGDTPLARWTRPIATEEPDGSGIPGLGHRGTVSG